MTELLKTALMITGFVLAMMLIIEYLNVLTAGEWQKSLAGHVWGQHLLAAFLGVVPGCLGAFTAVAMYTHGVLTLGAVVTAMIASSGDEAFVMLALIPRQAVLLMGIVFGIGLGVGVLVDVAGGRRKTRHPAACFELHGQNRCGCFEPGRIFARWKDCSPVRGTLTVALGLFLAGILAGQLGPPDWNWIRVTLAAVTGVAVFIVATVPDHFIDEHLWRHVAVKHAPQIFLWTLGALIAMHLLTDVLHLGPAIRSGRWALLLVACLVGLIPESGPNLIFITFFAQGLIPFGVLVANSIVQDGHGMLPMLAHSRREFLLIKAIAFAAALSFGSIALSLGAK
jgi:Putative, 10TM heavy-metal exporter